MTRFFIYLGLCLGSLWASQVQAQGLIFDDEAYDQVLLQPKFGQKSGAEDKFKVDLRPYCPPVQDQGKSNTCTGWAVGYAALSIEHAIQQGWENQRSKIKEESYSALFVYNQVKVGNLGGCRALSPIEEALELLKKKGNIKHKIFDGNGCNRFLLKMTLLLPRKIKSKNTGGFSKATPPTGPR